MPLVPKDGVKTRAQASADQAGEDVEAQRHEDVGGAASSVSPANPATAPTMDLSILLAAINDIKEQGRQQQAAISDIKEQGRQQQAAISEIKEQGRQQQEQQQKQQQLIDGRLQKQQELLEHFVTENAYVKEKLKAVEAQQDQITSDVGMVKRDLITVAERMDGLYADSLDIRTDMGKLEKELVKIKLTGIKTSSSDGNCHHQGPRVKVPSYDGATSWSAYRKQFELAAKVSAWTDEQCLTALSTALRGPALSVLDALPHEYDYTTLMEAMEARYGERHLEHVFRAQLKDRVQRNSEGLQQWALEIEKLVRKAYPAADAPTLNNNIVQAFTDGIKDLEVRSAVRLAHHKSMKEALAHALEVEAVRHESRTSRVREVVEVVEQARADGTKRLGPVCYACGERGHIRVNCRKRSTTSTNWRQRPNERNHEESRNDERNVEESAQQAQGNE